MDAAAVEFRLTQPGYGQQETITATWHREPNEPTSITDWIGLYRPDQTPSAASPILKWLYLNGDTAIPTAPVPSGSVSFPAPGLPVGDYVARFFANNGYEELAPAVPFTVIFGMASLSYDAGDDITVSWKRASETPRASRDWVGIYRPDQIPGGPASLEWAYLNGTRTAPAAPVEAGSLTFAAPALPPGEYVARFFANDGYTQLCAGIPFTVTAKGGPQPPILVGSPNLLRNPVAGVAYTGCVRGYARDYDLGEVLVFAKVSGPAWLNVSPEGELSGTPSLSDTGAAELVVAVTDLFNNTTAGTFHFEVRPPGQEQVTALNVMSYNLFHGWGMFNQGERKGFDSIALSRADIICTAESTDNINGSGQYQPREVAREFGWFYAGSGGGLGIISRWPVVETYPVPGGAGLGARLRLSENPLQEVVVYSVHFDARYYGPYEAKEFGSTNESVLLEEHRSQRASQAESVVRAMHEHLLRTDTTPVLVAGDFNSPSHLDWTPAAASRHFGRVVAWPVTRIMEDAGLVDSFRVANPDPVAVPGYTWSPVFTDLEPQDRIDFILFKGSQLAVLTSETFHPVVEVQVLDANRPLTPTRNNTWPSDHAAVVTQFHWQDRPLERWRHAHFGMQVTDPSVAGNQADPDGDGWCNLVEYAMGLPPLVANLGPSFGVENGRLTLEFSRSAEASDIQLTPEWSEDLHTWQPQEIDVEFLREADGRRWFKAQLPAHLTGPAFIRLHVGEAL